MSQNWEILGHESNPVPGDPGVVRKYAAEYATVAEAIGRASDRLRAISDRQDSESEFISKFRTQATEVATKISKAKTRYAGVAGAMADYAPPLEESQSLAQTALSQGTNSWETLQSSTLAVNKYQEEITYNSALTADEKQHYTQLLQHAQQQVADSTHGLAQARALLQSAIDQRDAAANRASSKIQNVQDTGGLDDNPWQQFWDRNGAWIGTAVNIIEDIGTVLLIVLAFVPGVDVLVAVLVIAFAVLEIANAAMQWSAGTMSPTEAIVDIALSLIPIGGVAAGARVMKGAASAAVETSMTSKAAQAISKFTRGSVTAEIEAGMRGPAASALRKLLTNDPEKIDQLKALANMALTKSGPSARIGAIAKQGQWIIRAFPGPVPEKILDEVVKGIIPGAQGND